MIGTDIGDLEWPWTA